MEDAAPLNERSKEVLEAVVHSYIGTVVQLFTDHFQQYKMNISPATIRNIMLTGEWVTLRIRILQQQGPTDLGYRYFVDI